MITLDEIKNLPAKEKWLIYTALQKDLDVPGEISYTNKEDELETYNNVEQEISEKEMLRYIPIIDDRLASGKASIFSIDGI